MGGARVPRGKARLGMEPWGALPGVGPFPRLCALREKPVWGRGPSEVWPIWRKSRTGGVVKQEK